MNKMNIVSTITIIVSVTIIVFMSTCLASLADNYREREERIPIYTSDYYEDDYIIEAACKELKVLSEEDNDTVICKALYKTKFRSTYIIVKGDASELNGLKVGDILIVNEYGKIVGYYKEASHKES